MANQADFEYIIVGQGIAGSTLAYQLIQAGKKIAIIDEPALSNASRIAAGIVNPVVFKRLTQSWKALETLAFSSAFYKEIEDFFHAKIYFEKTIARVLAGETEKNLWLKKSQTDVGKYISKEVSKGSLTPIKGDSEYGEVKGSGYLDTVLFLNLIGKYLKKETPYLQEAFDFTQLQISPIEIKYKKITAKKIIFCEGYRAIQNPYFKWLPFKLSKGELLTIKIENFSLDKIINKDLFILPIGNNLFKVGATNAWENLDEKPTEKGKSELIDKLNKILALPYEIVGHMAGIRPTVSDRKPLLGFHPEHPSVGVFNGMGTKSVMLAPYFAKQLINFIEHKTPLESEIDIARFWK